MTTLKTERAKKIVRKAEKDLIQARIKAINSILDNIGKQTELCRSSLASIISTQRHRECQGFIDKVSEIRFNKVKQRQLNKFQNLVNKKERNITRVSNNNSPQAGNNLVASRQAGTHIPSGEGSNTPLASPLLSPGEGDGPRASQAGLGTHLLSGEGSNSSPQATAHLPPKEGSSISLATAHLPPREGSCSSHATVHLPPGEAGSSSQATAHLPPGEGSSTSQATAHLPSREGSSSSQATVHLPPREGSSSSPQANTHPSPGEGRGNSQAGQVGNQVRSGRQGFRHSTRHRAPQASQENSTASQADSTNSWEGTPTPTIPNRLPQGSSNEEPNPKLVIYLSSKPLTPGLFLLKDPTLQLPPSNLLT